MSICNYLYLNIRIFGTFAFHANIYMILKMWNLKQKFSTILNNPMAWYSLGCVAAIVGPLPQIKVVLAEP